LASTQAKFISKGTSFLFNQDAGGHGPTMSNLINFVPGDGHRGLTLIQNWQQRL
jgi:hypothetical protein